MSGRRPHPAAEQALRDMLLAVAWRGFTPEAQAEVLAIHRGACAAPGADPREVADDIVILLAGITAALAVRQQWPVGAAPLDEGSSALLRCTVHRSDRKQALISFESMEGEYTIRVPLGELRVVSG